MSIVYRCSKYQSVCFLCLGNELIYLIVIKHTAFFRTLSTAYAVSQWSCSDLEYLIVYSLFLELLAYLVKCTVCIALRLRASIQH